MDNNNNTNEMFPDMTDQFAPADINENKNAATIAVIPPLFWVPLVSNSKDSPFAKFYANQGLILLIAYFVLEFVNAIMHALLKNVPVLPGLIGLICTVAPTAAFIYLLIAVLNGKAKPIPFIGTLFTLLK